MSFIILLFTALMQANALPAVQDSELISNFLDERCPKLDSRGSAHTKLACSWKADAEAVLNYEHGRSPAEVHLTWVRSLTQRLQSDDFSPIAWNYFVYLNDLQNLSVDTLYVLYKLRYNWREEGADHIQRALLNFLVGRIPGGALVSSLYRYRLTENLNAIWLWNIDPTAKSKAQAALNGWLQSGHNVDELQLRLIANGSGPTSDLHSSFVASVLTESSSGFMGSNPLEFLFRDPDANKAHFFFGLHDAELAEQWLKIRSSHLEPSFIKTFAARFLPNLPIEKFSNAKDCDWLTIALSATAQAGFPTTELVNDCRDNGSKGDRGVSFWASVGIGFEKPTPTLSRLNFPLLSKAIDEQSAQHWISTQVALWLLGTERIAMGSKGHSLDREFQLDAAVKLFLTFRRGLESPMEYIERTSKEEIK